MSKIYDNWERLVRATLRREQLRQIALRTPSDSSASSSPFNNFTASSGRLSSFSLPEDGPTAAAHIAARTFTFKEIVDAIEISRAHDWLGRNYLGPIYEGRLKSGKAVVIRDLQYSGGPQGNSEFVVEVLKLSPLHHPNITKLIGYCADGYLQFLVYEFTPLGSLAEHLYGSGRHKDPLDWNTRMKIAAGVAKGLEYLHEKANPPVIHGELKSCNIILDEGFHPKLSDFGLIKLIPVCHTHTHFGDMVVFTREKGCDYCALEYGNSGRFTSESDSYSFGVVLLELITGRLAYNLGESELVAWVCSGFFCFLH